MLDFPSYPQWAHTPIRNVEVVDAKPSSTSHADGPPVGTKLKIVLKGMTFSPIVVVSVSFAIALSHHKLCRYRVL